MSRPNRDLSIEHEPQMRPEGHAIDPSEAKAVLSAWQSDHHHQLKMLKDRYREVKAIGQRSLETRPAGRFATRRTSTSPLTDDAYLDDHPPASVKVGRNAPCPCGSGKKFKNCHGAV